VVEVKATVDTYPVLHFEIVALPVLAPDRETPWVLSGLFYYDWPARFSRPIEQAPRPGRGNFITQLLPRLATIGGARVLN